MHSNWAVGGVADVHWGQTPPREATPADCVQVYIVPDNGELFAESYGIDGKRIQFCGHGALAAAWVAFNEYAPDATHLNFASSTQSWQARRLDNDVRLIYRRPFARSRAIPDFAGPVLGAQPSAVAEMGGDAGYLVVQLPDAKAVQLLQPDLQALAAATDRAVIVTACESDTDFVFRYFAPQYGNPEDQATGSAAVQLAAYWGSKLPTSRFHVQQLSDHGAEMWVVCKDNAVELTARVAYR